MKVLIIALALSLAACASTPPLSNQIEATSKAIQDAALQIGQLQKTGIITNAKEDAWLDRLKEINKALRSAEALAASCSTDCSNAQTQLAAANQLLLQLQSELEKKP